MKVFEKHILSMLVLLCCCVVIQSKPVHKQWKQVLEEWRENEVGRYRKSLDDNQEAMRGEATDQDDTNDYVVDDGDDDNCNSSPGGCIDSEEDGDDNDDDDGCLDSPNVCP